MTTDLEQIAGVDPDLVRRIHGFIIDHEFGETLVESRAEPFWDGLAGTGTQLWLDTGDIGAAERLWNRRFSALTTNNSLLNAEVQRGVYDDVIRRAAAELAGSDPLDAVLEIAFVLNAIHGLRLVERFGGLVSVELHTDLADDDERAVAYGQRLHAVAPDHFLVKVPFTPAGLVTTRRLRELGVRVNLTLGFSARQNYLATALARPDYVNVFLGRIGAFLRDNRLGDGVGAGERAAWASQRVVRELGSGRAQPTRQIAASLRDARQLPDLAGIDVVTMPAAVAEDAPRADAATWRDRSGDPPVAVRLEPGVDPLTVRLEQLWEVDGAVCRLAERLAERRTFGAPDVVGAAVECGCADLFPAFSREERRQLAMDGKIPRQAAWEERIAAGEIGPDALLGAAGLAAFAADQRRLDERIARLIAR